MDLELEVGSGKSGVGDGSGIKVRGGKTGEVIIGFAHGRFYEAATRNNLYIASVSTAGVAHGTAFGTTTPITLWNPTGSGVLISVKRIVIGYVSGTFGVGSLAYGQNLQGASAPSGTELVPVNCLIGGAGRGRGRSFTGANASGATPTLIRSGIVYGAFVGGAGPIPPPLVDEIDDEFILYPGGLLAVQGIGTGGTTPLIIPSITYEEIPLT